MRVGFNMPVLNAMASNSSFMGTPADHLVFVQGWRDYVNARLLAEGVDADFKVSDIFKWTASSFTGRAFIIHHVANDSALLVIYPAFYNSSSWNYNYYWLGGSGSVYRDHVFAAESSGDGSTSADPGPVFFYLSDFSGLASTYEFDDLTELTYTGGDDTALSTLVPETSAGLQAIRPADQLPGVDITSIAQNSSNASSGFWMCYDDELDTWCLFSTTDHDRSVVMLGKWIEPADTDTDRRGLLRLRGNKSSAIDHFDVSTSVVDTFDAAGTQTRYTFDRQEIWTTSNWLIATGANAGKVNWRLVEINGAGGVKGHGAAKAVVEATPYDNGAFIDYGIEMFDADHPSVVMLAGLAVLWQAGFPLPFTQPNVIDGFIN